MDGKQLSKLKTGYSIRKAEIKDIKTCVKLAEQGSFEVDIAGFDEDHVFLLTKSIIKKGVGVVLCYEDNIVGYIGGVIQPHPYDPKFNILLTSSWYVTPSHRNYNSVLLLKNYIKEGKKKDIHIIRMQARLAKDPIDMTRLYERMGFECTEIAFEMDVA
jgi:hypothetical protein